jgi:hypothetical protein
MRQIRTELKDATKQRKDVDQQIRRLRAAEAALNGGRSPSAKMLNRAQLRSYLVENPGSRSLEIADTLGVPPGSVRTLLSTMKKDGEVRNESQRWYAVEGTG